MRYDPKDYIEAQGNIYHVHNKDHTKIDFTTDNPRQTLTWLNLKIKKWLAEDAKL